MVPLQYKPDEGDNASLDPAHISSELTLAIKRYPKPKNSITGRNILGVCMSNLAILTLYSRLVSFFIYGGFLAFLAVSDQRVSTASFIVLPLFSLYIIHQDWLIREVLAYSPREISYKFTSNAPIAWPPDLTQYTLQSSSNYSQTP